MTIIRRQYLVNDWKVIFMMDMNTIVAGNVLELLKKNGKKQTDLAEAMGIPRQTMNKMLNGGRSIGAADLAKMAEYFGVTMERLVQLSVNPVEQDVVRAFMGRVETDDAKRALQVADEVSDLILFHSRVRRNGTDMMHPVEV